MRSRRHAAGELRDLQCVRECRSRSWQSNLLRWPVGLHTMRGHGVNPGMPRSRSEGLVITERSDRFLPARRFESSTSRRRRLSDPAENKAQGENQSGTAANWREATHVERLSSLNIYHARPSIASYFTVKLVVCSNVFPVTKSFMTITSL